MTPQKKNYIQCYSFLTRGPFCRPVTHPAFCTSLVERNKLRSAYQTSIQNTGKQKYF